MSEGGLVQPEGPRDERSGRSGGSNGWRRKIAVGGAVLALVGVGVGAWLLGSSSGDDREIHIEAADSVGLNPFTTDGITLAALVVGSPPSSKAPGLFGGSGDNGVCAPEELVAFLQANGDKAAAWVAALNADPTLSWSGTVPLRVTDIPAYVAELTPAHLADDLRVTNHGYRNGSPTPRQSVLKAGTAVLVDAQGVPRVRCYCGNPLAPADGGGSATASTASTASTAQGATTTVGAAVTQPPTTIAGGGGDHDGDGPEPTNCPPVTPVPSNATNVSTALVDFDGDGSADILRVYELGGVWRVRAEANGAGMDDEVLAGTGPMAAIGGATVNNDTVEEAWVKVGTGPQVDIIGVLVFANCDLHRVHLNGQPAAFPIGSTASNAAGLGCFGFNVGIEVFTSSSSDSVTYTGTSQVYTLDLMSTPPSLVLGATANQSETDPSPGFTGMSTFNCDNLSAIP